MTAAHRMSVIMGGQDLATVANTVHTLYISLINRLDRYAQAYALPKSVNNIQCLTHLRSFFPMFRYW